ncbi:MAG: transposase zinc-binding domain-containing protein, partial [Lentisphaeria bacterium]|nr:transposase zinc-binding domain-containing protein [Lentisphaeria bacterium]
TAVDRPEHSVGEIFRRFGAAYSRRHRMGEQQRRVMKALAMCRTAALGGHLEECDACGAQRPVYNSCGNRHCPACQGKLARKWLAARMGELLPIPYFHLVFTLPDTFVPLALGNPDAVYGLLLRTAGDVLLAAAAKTFGGVPPVIAVLHTWGQTMWPHPHGHFIVGSGALRFDGRVWAPGSAQYLFDVRELSARFRDLFCRRLSRARLRFAGETAHWAAPGAFEAFLEGERSRDWVGRERAAKLARSRELLACEAPSDAFPAPSPDGTDRDLCPFCGRGRMHRIGSLGCERGPPVVVAFVDGSALHAA